MTTPGKLEVTIKINALPTDVETLPNTWKRFKLDCGAVVTVTVRPKLWTKLETAARDWPEWVAAITGKMGPDMPHGFELLDVGLQVFEKKAKPPVTEGKDSNG